MKHLLVLAALFLCVLPAAQAKTLTCHDVDSDCGDGGPGSIDLKITETATGYHVDMSNGCLLVTDAPSTEMGHGWYDNFQFDVPKSGCSPWTDAGFVCQAPSVAMHTEHHPHGDHAGPDFTATDAVLSLSRAQGEGVYSDQHHVKLRLDAKAFGKNIWESFFFINSTYSTDCVFTD